MYNKFQQVYDFYCREFRKIQVDSGTSPKKYGQMLSYKKKRKKNRQN